MKVLFIVGLMVSALLQAQVPEEYNVHWASQSKHSGDSMPCVGGDIGLNVWVENDELLFYIGRMGARDENGSLLKMGRVRVAISPSPFGEGAEFRQSLILREGHVEIEAKMPDGNAATIRVWVEINRPVARVDIETSLPSQVDATYESWRHQRIELPNTGKNLHRGQCLINYDNFPGEVFVEADDFHAGKNAMRFWHRMDEKRNVFHHLVESQGLGPIKDQLVDPCRNLIFGGELFGRSGDKPFVFAEDTMGEYALTPFKGWRYRSQEKAKQHRIDVVTLIEQSDTVAQWHEELDLKAKLVAADDLRQIRMDVRDWWLAYWNRSHIHINLGKGESDAGWRMGRNYALFRYMLASGLGGREPIMFNGGVLTFDPIYAAEKFEGPGYTPDHRQWGAALTGQNQRCMYWPMLKSGDLDLLKPGFNYYRDGLTNTRARTKHYWGHDGCSFTEQITIPWLPGAMVYGYAGEQHKGKTRRYRPPETETGICVNPAVNYIYESQLEWAWMILEYQRFTGADISEYLPFIEQSVIFYDEHYRMREKRRTGKELTDDVKLHISPSNTLENHSGGGNPTSVVAGLHQVLGRLIEIAKDVEKRERWQRILATLPNMPTGEVAGHKVLKPTTKHHSLSGHMPEMYPLYPYQMFQLGKPGIELMRNTFLFGVTEEGRDSHLTWLQGAVHYALLGMTREAQALMTRKLDNGPYRFPAFWPPDIDHAPDHNWGGMAMIGLQEMLLQTGDERILLLPAWPKEWEVDFKLHAPGKTLVEVTVEDSKVAKLEVSPAKRGDDVVIWPEAK